jgi:titin
VIDGLVLGGGHSVVRGLLTFEFGLNDIHVACRGNIVEGNLIGIDLGDTVAALPDRAGVRIGGVGANTIGGTALAARNVISGKTDGVLVAGSVAAGNRTLGNFTGTSVGGTGGRGHASSGIFVTNAPNTAIGGTAAGARNVIAGNARNGIDLVDAPTSTIGGASFSVGNLISGNQHHGIRIFGLATRGRPGQPDRHYRRRHRRPGQPGPWGAPLQRCEEQ